MKIYILGSIIMLAIIGCAGTSNRITGDTYPSHNKKVFLSKETLPSDGSYEVIGVVKTVKSSYGSSGIEANLADEARQIGADGVIGIRTWRAPAGFAWSAPHAEGEAIKFGPNFDTSKIEGQWR